ncbi:MAG: excinuclease ABC subunit UvrA [Pirellulales bacterium]|nr:excinuclease ABC subunit UvrA [Pirellulales bacterium]
MAASDIVITGAREHNLRDVSLVLPRNRLICFTGVSGSGKSSMAFDTLYAEGQRRYVESLSSYARQFLGQMPKPEVDSIEGLSPSISIAQKSTGQSPRSTVGTITEIYDFLRVLYARVGRGHCPECGRALEAQTREQILQQILGLPDRTAILVLAPLIRTQKGEFRDLFADLRRQGFVRARVDGRVVRLGDDLNLDRQMRHNIEVVVDRLAVGAKVRARMAEAVELALKLGEGNLIVAGEEGGQDVSLSAHYACTHCRRSFEPPSPQMFSFNSPQGMCLACDGLGEIYGFDPDRLIADPAKSFQQGCVELIGRWRQMGRWRRHIFRGVADTLEREYALEPGTILETAWEELDERVRRDLLFGTGDRHITFTWRAGSSGRKWGGKYEGIIPKLLSQYRNTRSRMQRRALEKYMRVIPCGPCQGERLNPQARAVTLTTASPAFADAPARSLPRLCAMPVTAVKEFFTALELDATGRVIAEDALKEIRGRLGFLTDVGLDYLTLDRTAPTLSGGEMQRIRLAGQIGCGLVGVLYILDEPSIGLHARDNDRLLATLARLRDQGNTVVVVEHDEETMRAADHVVDFGPGPGVRGGHVVAAGPADRVVKEPESITGAFLSGKRAIAVPERRRSGNGHRLIVRGATHNNLKDIDVEIPLGRLVCVTGVSGSGKSSLASDILVEALRRDLNGGLGQPGEHRAIEGLEHLDKMIAIDQSPIGRTPRSNPGTYIKVFDEIRHLYCQLPQSKARGYKPGRFSFNVSGGRCEACEGNGSTRLEMDFLADVWVTCPVCKGHRFNRETLQVQFKGKSIAQVLEMDVQEALAHFENMPKIHHKLQTLHDVGLDYMKLGQPSPTLSGGEAQRVKLARELVKKSTGRTLYLLDEPTTGLHFADIELLLRVLDGFVEAGNTVLVVEHNLEVIKTADWIIDLGPEGGEEGGRIVAAGTPEEVARVKESHTGRVLRGALDGSAPHRRKPAARKRGARSRPIEAIRVRGARQHNLKGVDVDVPRDRMTVCCGVSGSGKTSLAMDTIYAEGQRRYVESLSAYARQFVGQMQKPKLDQIEGLSPAVAIEQKHAGHTPRSTVGTVTEIYDYLRILVARLGQPYCPECNVPIGTQSADEIIGKIMALPQGTKLHLMAPLEIQVGERYETFFEEIRSSGYVRVRIDGQTYPIDEAPLIDRRRRHAVEVVVDRVTVQHDARSRIADSVENALSLGAGVLRVAHVCEDRPEPDWPVQTHSQHYACDGCGRSFEPLAPHHFSFNSALGWCPACEGLGTQIGANPAALLHDTKKTLAQGAVDLWPRTDSRLFQRMLEAFSHGTGVPVDVPYEQLAARHRRVILHGSGTQWFDVRAGAGKHAQTVLRFQYKGLYPALDEAARLSVRLRGQLEHLVDEVECSECGGSRLRDDAAAVRFRGQTIDEICRKPLGAVLEEFRQWQPDEVERQIAGEVAREVVNRLTFLVDVGLEYLTLARPAPSLSGGEMQRIRLAAQVGSGLCGVLYVLDEPTIGLHPRDNRRLIAALHKLRDLGNTLLLVEHDREVIRGADRLLDFGPRAGRLGGQIVAQGTPEEIARRRQSVTGPYLSGKRAIPVPTNRRIRSEDDTPPGGGWLEVLGARHHNLKNIDSRIPLGTFTVVTGPSGSGKSSLVDDVIHAELARTLHRAKAFSGAHDALRGVERISKVIQVTQQPLGQTPTSNAATFTGVFDLIRSLFAQLPEARVRGYTARRFSFNVPGGRCEKCEGNGQLKIEMHFLPDVWVECDACGGKRYDRETLEVKYHGQSIADVLDMPCGEALRLFANIPKIRRILQTLSDVGLDYLTLGQSAPTLSGGEAQRVKLAAELARPEGGNTLYLLDEPTTGLHFDDLAKLLDVLNRLVELGNTVVVIEHNLDVIKTADWVIDLGPEAGDDGGYVVAAGTPEQVAQRGLRASETNTAEQPRARRKTTAVQPKRGAAVILSEAKDLKKKRILRSAQNDGRKKSDGLAQNDMLRSHTGEALAPVLAAGPREPRKAHDFVREGRTRQGDLDIAEVGGQTRMPWEADGRRWHTRDRVGHNGRPCRWDGRILAEVVDRIEQANLFGPTDWSERTIVEIRPEKKSLGWFFHALTAEEWLLKMKFRIARSTFRRDDLVERLDLKPLNDVPELPLYGTEPRVRCGNLAGPWQEVELRVHNFAEIDRPAFWEFLDRAIDGFRRFVQHAEKKPSDLMPWKALGRKWHFLHKGFPRGKTPAWHADTLESVCALVEKTAGRGEFAWTAKQLVHFTLPGVEGPWLTVLTKKVDAVHVVLYGPAGRFPLGRIKDLGHEAELLPQSDGRDALRLRFRNGADLARGDLPRFLKEHLAAVRGGGG